MTRLQLPSTPAVRARHCRARGAHVFLLLGFTAFFAPVTQAADFAIEAGQSWSGRSGLGSTHAAFIQVGSGHRHPVLRGKLQVQPIITAGIVAGRDQGSHRRDAWLAGAGLRVTRSGHDRDYWFWESCVLASSGDTPSLSGHLQFANGFGYAHGSWELKVRHISNAGLHEPNHGETMMLLGYSF